MARLTELTREHYNEFKKVKQIHSPLFGDCCLYGRKGAKYLAKHLDGTQHMPFTTTRTNSIPFYLPENKQSVYFFEQEGESLEGILEHKLISNRLSSKHNNSQLICWMTKYKSFEINLWEILKLGVKVITTSPVDIILGCFRVVKSKVVYHYDSWMVPTDFIVRDSFQDLEKYYFSEKALKNIRDHQNVPLTETQALFRLAFLVLHVGTRDLNLRFYEYGLYMLNHQNMSKRLEVFLKRFPKLGQKVEHILQLSDDQEYILEDFSSINIDSTLMRNLNSSSVDDCKSNPRKSLHQSASKPSKISIIDYSKSKKKIVTLKTEECRALQLECPVLNLLEKMKSISWSTLLDIDEVSLLDYLGLQEYYPICLYEQKLVRLLSRVYIKIVYSKKEYSNNSVYVGEMRGDSREGKGLYLFESGDIYYGNWDNNNMHGAGLYVFKNGDSYEGELSSGLKHGHGRNEYASGNVYEGSWIDNYKRGLGVVSYKNGTIFVGEFFGNQKPAEGVYVSQDGRPVQGINDQENCSPELKSHKRKVVEKTNFVQSCVCSDGEYSGEIVNGVREGFGCLNGNDCVYEGQWRSDMRHGPGRLKARGFDLDGIWEDGLLVEYR